MSILDMWPVFFIGKYLLPFVYSSLQANDIDMQIYELHNNIVSFDYWTLKIIKSSWNKAQTYWFNILLEPHRITSTGKYLPEISIWTVFAINLT